MARRSKRRIREIQCCLFIRPFLTNHIGSSYLCTRMLELVYWLEEWTSCWTYPFSSESIRSQTSERQVIDTSLGNHSDHVDDSSISLMHELWSFILTESTSNTMKLSITTLLRFSLILFWYTGKIDLWRAIFRRSSISIRCGGWSTRFCQSGADGSCRLLMQSTLEYLWSKLLLWSSSSLSLLLLSLGQPELFFLPF